MAHGVLASCALLAACLAILLLLAAALHDLALRTIPNGLCLALAASGLLLRGLDNTLPIGLAAGGGVFALGFLCWRRGWIGGGDVKLLAAAALVVPAGLVPFFLLDVAMAGGLLAAAYLVLHALLGRSRPGLRPSGLALRLLRAERWRIGRAGPLPYGAAIAAGACFSLISF